MTKKIMITVAPVARVPNPDGDVINPLTPEDVAEQTIACARAGAAQVHLHVRALGFDVMSIEEAREVLGLVSEL